MTGFGVEVRRLDVSLFAATAGEVPATDTWLSAEEREVLRGLTLQKRRRDWRLGRWAARQAVARALEAPGAAVPTALSILAAEDGAPEVRWTGTGTGRPAPGGCCPSVVISISHSADQGFAVAAVGDGALGCDVERVAPRSERFVADYFTVKERAYVNAAGRGGAGVRARAATLVWSAKESALKALRQGLRADTRSVEVAVAETAPDLSQDTWRPLSVVTDTGARMAGHWRVTAGAVWTVVADRPIRLR